jgi:hypothetical protein
MKNNKNNKRKMAVAVLAGLALTGLIGASAASLGGITSTSLGADAEDVLSCDTDSVTASYNTSFVPDAPGAAFETADDINGRFNVDSVTIGNVNDDCDGLVYEVLLLDQDNDVIAEASDTVELVPDPLDLLDPTDDFDAAPFDGPVDAELVYGIAITISG